MVIGDGHIEISYLPVNMKPLHRLTKRNHEKERDSIFSMKRTQADEDRKRKKEEVLEVGGMVEVEDALARFTKGTRGELLRQGALNNNEE